MDPPLPELSEYQSMIWRAFLEVGPAMPGSMDEVPLSWAEVDAFARNSPEITDAWEVQALVRMSQEYLSERRRGTEALTKAPMEREEAV
ncbi:hypothetical protein [Leisingera methylohalidivorans]|uniref:Uncharacterized protein n=1 Tax=Leisingera methylohalidivorans DSM 14336 TaxID=999552 RepID=V9W1A6_9RHOB|nr:hypothetical protein [Leisingera methylohalidivorans]AHD02952.1 hypothetical protein METH_06890 [Leisingera methylohalidivorans DSM 14336]